MIEQEKIESIKMGLLIAEAFNHAYIGSTYSKTGKNARAYARWQRKKEREIHKIEGRQLGTVWDRMPKKRKAKKF